MGLKVNECKCFGIWMNFHFAINFFTAVQFVMVSLLSWFGYFEALHGGVERD